MEKDTQLRRNDKKSLYYIYTCCGKKKEAKLVMRLESKLS